MKLGAQMFTVREQCKTPEEIEIALEKIAQIGYRAVQVSGLGPIEPKRLKDCCDRLGLTIAVTHIPPGRLLTELGDVLAEHTVYGCKNIGLGMLPEEYRGSMEGVERFCRDFLPVARKIRDAGCQFHYHNHNLEFERFGGRMVIDRLADMFAPEEMHFILDTYWVQAGGCDPAGWIKKLSGRLSCVHLKDMAVHGMTQVMAPVGKGNLDFPAILDACEKAGTQWLLVEQDTCEGDPFASLDASYQYLRTFGYR